MAAVQPIAAGMVQLGPLERFLRAGRISRIELSAASGVNLRAIRVLIDDGDAVYRLPLSTLVRLAVALGVAPAELVPALARRPRGGLLAQRGVKLGKAAAE